MKTPCIHVLALALFATSACVMVPSTASPSPSMMPTAPSAAATATTATGLAPNAAADLLRRSIVGTRPLLLPNTVPDTWLADVKIESATAFSATYREPAGGKTFTLRIAVANPPLPTANTVQAHPSFHGDASSLYQVASATDPTSDRLLMWTEAGVWPGWPHAGVPYLVSTTGISDSEFWRLANGLHPDQIGG